MGNKITKQNINSDQLRKLPTLITEFMVDRSSYNKNFEQLLEIFISCYKDYSPDPSNDLRIHKYAEDMKTDNWNSPIYLIFQDGEVKDGVHRGVAYLKCIEDGCIESELPEIFLIKIN